MTKAPDSTTSIALIERIRTRKAVVAVVGLGYVGLPLAVVFAEAGFTVVGIDLDERKVTDVNHSHSYLSDMAPERLAGLADGRGKLSATTDYRALAAADVAIVCVPTPLSKTRDPDLSYIVSAADEIARCALARRGPRASHPVSQVR